MTVQRKLVFITEQFAPDLGGVARSETRTVQTLARAGFDIDVFCWTRTLPAGHSEVTQISTSESSSGSVGIHRLGLFAQQDYSLQHSLTYLETLHKRTPCDGVWGHALTSPGFLAVLFAKSIGVPVTLSARGNDVDLQMFPPGDLARLVWSVERATSLTAVSMDLAKKLRILTRDDLPVRVVHNSVDPDIYRYDPDQRSLRQRLGIESTEVVLGFSGELRHKKGLVPLLAAYALVSSVRPARLLIIGEVRLRDQAALASFAIEHPEAHSRIVVTGHLTEPREIARHLNLCDLFLQPSYWDGLPNAVLEAMACERIILASDAGGIPEAIVNGESGFLIPRSELHRLGEGILELLSLSESQKRKIGQAARSRILERFSPACEEAALRDAMRDLFGML